jgi:hypothetical protein
LLIEIFALVTGIKSWRAIVSAVNELYQATKCEDLCTGSKSNGAISWPWRVVQSDDRFDQSSRSNASGRAGKRNASRGSAEPTVPAAHASAWKSSHLQGGEDGQRRLLRFYSVSPTRIAIAIADISGKGSPRCSADGQLARAWSQLLAPGSDSMSTAELVALNAPVEILLTTASRRFLLPCMTARRACFAIPTLGICPFCICGDHAFYLDKVDMLGLEEYVFEEGTECLPMRCWWATATD